MATREEIREGIKNWLLNRGACHDVDCGNTNCNSECPYLNTITDNFILECLHSQGVAIKVEGELPKMSEIILGATWEEQREVTYKQAQQDMLKAGYTQWETLIKGK